MVTNLFVMLKEFPELSPWRRARRAMAYGLLLLTLPLWQACEQKSHSLELASVDGQPILMEEFLAQSAFMGLGKDPAALTPDLRRAVLETMVRQRLLLGQAQAKSIRLEPEELDREEASLRRGLSEEAFEASLIAQGIEYDEWRRMLSQEILLQKALDLLLGGRVHVAADDLRGYYQEHREEFRRPEQVLAQHVLMPSQQAALELLRRLAKGQDLAKAAADLGVALPDDGEPTWLARGHMPQALEDSIFALQPGKLAGPLASAYGFHVVRVLAKRPAAELDLTQAAEEIQHRLSAEKREALAASYIEDLRAKAQVVFDARFEQNGTLADPGGQR